MLLCVEFQAVTDLKENARPLCGRRRMGRAKRDEYEHAAVVR